MDTITSDTPADAPSALAAPSASAKPKKAAKTLIGGLLGLVVLCVGLGLGGYIYLRGRASTALSTDRTTVERVANDIAGYRLPRGYEPIMSVELNTTKIAIFGHDTNNSMISLMALPANASEADVESVIAQVVERQTRSSISGVHWTKSETQIVSVSNQSYGVKVSEGTDSQGNVMRRITGVLPAQHGSVGLYVMGATKTWDQAALDGFFASLN